MTSSLRFATERTVVIDITGDQIATMTNSPIRLIAAVDGKFILPRHAMTEVLVASGSFYAPVTTGVGSITKYDDGNPVLANSNVGTVGGTLGALLSGLLNVEGTHFMLTESDFGLFTIKTLQSFLVDVSVCTSKALDLTFVWGNLDPTPPGPIPLGPLVTSTLTSGGTGYVVGDTGEVADLASSGNTRYQVTSVDGGGSVTGYTITDPGAAMDATPFDQPKATTHLSGSGTGLEITVTEITEPVINVRFTIEYDLVDPLGVG